MNKELTIMQQSFLDHLVTCNGDTKRAADLAGYAEGSYTSVVKALKTEIIELAENILAQNAPKASLKLIEVMDSSNPIPQANVRLQAAQTLLDRVGIGKTDKLDVNLQNSNGLFILPAKEQVVIEGQYEEA